MKNIVKNIAVAFVSIICFGGCSKEFLDEVKPTTGVPIESVFKTRATANGAISGIMRGFRSSNGVNSMFFARTLKGNDVILSTADGSFLADYENNNREPTYNRSITSWNYPFNMINQINNFIKSVNASALADKDKKELLGQGYALRAFFYHQLVLEFSKSYNEDQNFPAPPIYKEPTATAKEMSSVKEVYDFMVDDLTKAVSLLPDTRLGKSYVNKQVANAILAQVYQVMGKWDLAESTAKVAYGGNQTKVLDAATYNSGFKDYASIEWLWGCPQSADQNMTYNIAPHSYSDSAGYYATAYVNSTFVSLFSAKDVRRLFDIKNTKLTSDDYRYYVSNKFSFSFTSHFPIIRYAEMILIDAEAKARQGKDVDASTVLYALQKNRDVNAVKSSNTGQALIDEILVERRKELFMENGVEWFDAKRLGKGIPRDGNQRLKGINNITGTTYDLQPHDLRFMLKVPQAEIDSNPLISKDINSGR